MLKDSNVTFTSADCSRADFSIPSWLPPHSPHSSTHGMDKQAGRCLIFYYGQQQMAMQPTVTQSKCGMTKWTVSKDNKSVQQPDGECSTCRLGIRPDHGRSQRTCLLR